MGCEARKTPAVEVVFFLDFYLYRTYQDLAIFRSVLSVTALAVIMRRACAGANLSSSPGESQS
jgi:hypothetical protein